MVSPKSAERGEQCRMIARDGTVRYREPMFPSETAIVDIEVSRFSFVKRRPDGTVDFVAPFPSMFSYGSVAGSLAPDGDPQDALIVGASPQRGDRVEFPIWGEVRFIDGGIADHKWVVGPRAPRPWEWQSIAVFFRVYALAKRGLGCIRGANGPTVFRGVQQD